LSHSLMACQAPTNTTPPSTQTPLNNTHTKTFKVGTSPHGISANAAFVYNSNTGDKTLSVIDSHSDTVVKTLTLHTSPGYSKASHDGRYILVLSKADTNASQLHIFEPGQDHRLVQSLAVGQGADKIQISDDDQHVYVSLT